MIDLNARRRLGGMMTRIPPSSETLDKFASIVGDAHALRAPDAMAPYLREWRDRYVGEAAMVVKPASTQEVADILRVAHDSRTAIVPQGGNTGLVGGQIPFESGHEVVLSLSRMDKIVDVDPLGNCMTVEAGAILQNIQTAAEQVDRLFPLSLASEGSCQIGGNLATNAGGVGVIAYGNARDLTLGLEVVLADGRIWNGLKRLRKDNTGYDLRDLFVGSEGTLGIITRAVLKLFPKPSRQDVAFAGLESLEDVARFYTLLSAGSGPGLTAFELIPQIGIEFVTSHLGGRVPLASSYPWYVLAELSGFGDADGEETTADHILSKALEKGFVKDAVLAQTQAQGQALWHLRDGMSEAQKFEGGSIKHDISVPTAMIPAFIDQANDLVQKAVPGARPVPFGHFGDGNIHYNVSQPPGVDKQAFLDRWDDVNEAVYGLALTMDGSISAEHGIGRMKRDFLARTKDPVGLEIMRSIKRRLDPHGILNPGKVL